MRKKKRTKRRLAKQKVFQTRFLLLYVSVVVLGIGFGILRNNWLGRRESFVCANSISCIKNLSGKFEEGALTGEFLGTKVTFSKTLVQNLLQTQPAQVLGQSSANKKIYIDLTTQHLYAKEGDTTIFDFPVSTGKWWHTPTGTFNIWIKLRYTRMTGGNKAIGTFYDLPNVPFTMFFYNAQVPKWQGYGVHGAYWHNNFGHPMSHGCINTSIADSEKLFVWADPPTSGYTTFANLENPGTQIIISGQTPKE